MGEKVINVIVEGGKATAGPPIGPALGPLGINAGQVVAEINKATKDFAGMKVPVKIIVDTSSKTFTIEVGTPPVAELLKKEAGIEKGSGAAGKENVGNITMEAVVKIAKSTMQKSLSKSLVARVKEVLGTCLSLGLMVEGKSPKEVIREVEAGKYDSLLAER